MVGMVGEEKRAHEFDDLEGEEVVLNMGPQHPATHGVLQVVLRLNGETVISAKPVVGYLHRGMEKIAENMTYHQFIPYTDRLDYLAPLSNNTGFALAVEKLIGVEAPPRAQAIRVTICELSRISAHLLWLGTQALDLGAASVFFHTFRERETLYNLFEMLTGTRLTTSYTRVGGLFQDLPENFLVGVRDFIREFTSKVDEWEGLLTRNRIWMERTQDIGVLSKEDAVALSMTGPNLRASGVEWDLRKADPYCGYDELEFEVPTGSVGDVYDRYLVRLEEMRQSTGILRQIIDRIPDGPICVDNLKLSLPVKDGVLTKMEDLIHQFMLVTEGFTAPEGEIYRSIEAPKGELGFYIVSTGGKSPYRMHIRSPSFISLQAVPKLVEGRSISDVIAIIASLDPVMGEVDR
ncbi:MAG: NADH dehydrogenase (quinone) subunit D [Acidobacteriota bacterium]